AANAAPLGHIGWDQANNVEYFPGSLDEVAYFNYPLSAGQVQMIYSDAGSNQCLTPTAIANNLWTRISGVWDGSSLELFVNGRSQCKKLVDGFLRRSPATVYAGSDPGGGYNWQGGMADLRIYGTAGGAPITGTDVYADFAATANRFRPVTVPDIVTNGLVLHLDSANADSRGLGALSTGCGAGALKWYDLSPTGVVGSLANFSACTTTGWQGDGTPVANPNVLTTGATGYVTVPSPNTISGSFTVEGWVNPVNSVADNAWFGTRNIDAAVDIKFYSSRLYVDVGTGPAWLYTGFASTPTYAVNTWYHVALAVKPTGFKIYLNGAIPAGGTGAWASNTPMLASPSRPMGIGSDSGAGAGEPFNGKIGKIAVYNRELTQAEIRQNCAVMASRFGVVCN
ncbi:MAG TPA: LamG-like jellyroll fold domain-containing protein, partial [Bdellovibrionota bacterium]|nr:LamG-like jellyroll fold domain-containing protein [Bdellovibrionota bacterium]